MICQRIQDIRRTVDHVIISPHWGEEHFRIPSPEQIKQAHAFIDAGASVVAGHHPHVLQGMNLYHGSPIAYSLGNFLANTVYWADGDSLIWDRWGRTGCILLVDLHPEGIRAIEQILTYDNGKTIALDRSRKTRRHNQRLNRRVSRGITKEKYERERFRVHKIRPIIFHLRWVELRRLRPRHVFRAFNKLFRNSG
jgi:poly-gamma-glutamate synthesis protein (capsule biosynthesis protein)